MKSILNWQSRQTRIVMSLALVLIYALTYSSFYSRIGDSVGIIAIAPVIAIALMFGLPGGLAAGLLFSIINMSLTLSGERELAAWAMEGGLIGGLALVFVGSVVGRMRDMSKSLSKKEIENRVTEEERQKIAEYLDTILLNIPMGVAILEGPEFRYFRINQILADINGLSIQEHLGKPLADVLPDAATDILPGLSEVLQKGKPSTPREFSTRLPKDPNEDRFFIDAFFPIDLKNRKPEAVGVIVVDVTEKKNAEELTKTQAYVLENMDEGVSVADENGLILFGNTAFERLFGYERDELIGKHVSILNADPPEQLNNKLDELRKEIQISGFWRGEFTNIRKNGTLFLTSAHISKIDVSGKKLWISVQDDITVRKQEEEARNLRAAEMEALYQTSLEINKLSGIDNLLFDIVKRAVNLLDVNRGEALLMKSNGKSLQIAAVYPPNEKLLGTTFGISQGLAGRIAETGEPYMLHEIANKENGRTSFPNEDDQRFLGVPLKVQEKVIGVLSVFDEYHAGAFEEESIRLLSLFAAQAAIAVENNNMFTKVNDGRRELRLLSNRLMHLHEDERRMIARELHDQIGQTLTAVKLNLEALSKGNENASFSAGLEESIKLVEESVNQVRELSLELRPPELDDLGLIPALRWYVDHQVKRAGLEADMRLPGHNITLAPEAEIACFRVVQEAMTNTIRHANANGILLELLERGKKLELTFKDDGVGFDSKSAMERIGQGKSLGLIGMKERIELVGGKLVLSSKAGEGTKITLSLPLDSSENVENRSIARN